MRRHAKAIVAVSAMLLTLALGVTFAGAVPPVLTIDPASSVSYTSAHVSGTVDTEDEQAYYYFQYAKVGSGSWSSGAFQGPIPAGSGPENVSDDLTGLMAGTEYEVRLLATPDGFGGEPSPEPNPTFTTDPVDVPTVSIDPVSSITGDTAHFSGTINPNLSGGNPAELSDVDWRFECTPACPDAGSGTIEADAVNHVVSGDATGLDPNTDYEVRLVAENAGQPLVDTASFKTSAPPPVVEALPPAVITDTSAWIGGEVNPRNFATTYYIEYSSDPGFATSVSVPATQDASAGSGNQLVFVNHHAEGLQPGTTYYYRVVASGSGTTTGESESFETLSEPYPVGNVLPDGRVYERVSPVDKNGGEIHPGSASQNLAIAAVDGDSVAYLGLATFSGEGGALFNEYISERTASGWISRGLGPRIEPRPDLANTSVVPWLSSDLSRALVSTPAALNPGDRPHARNLYLRDNQSNVFQSIPSPVGEGEETTWPSGATNDGQHIVFNDGVNGTGGLWLWSDGQSREVSVRPDGIKITGTLGAHQGSYLPGENAISDDGSRVYFTHDGFPRNLYMRNFEGAEPKTVLVSETERTGGEPADNVGKFELASKDGSVAFLTADAPLTDDSLDYSLYRWDSEAPQGARLTDIGAEGAPVSAGALGTVGANEDATIVYFTATGKLTAEATVGAANLYRWEQGEGLRFVASLQNEPVDRSTWSDNAFGGEVGTEGVYRQARVTPDGRFLAFATREALTAYDTDDTSQLYLYDSADGGITCVTCSAVDPKGRNGSWFSSAPYLRGTGETQGCCHANVFGYLPRSLAADGSRIVFDSNESLVPEDNNGVIDVYQWVEGNVQLISTGDSSVPSRVLDVSADGQDIFFTTSQSLVPSDIDTDRDVYDARVNGTPEVVPQAPCVGDECQGTPSAPPGFNTPSSAGFEGQGNQASGPRARCGKTKVRRRGRCVQPRHKKKAKKAKRAKQGRTH